MYDKSGKIIEEGDKIWACRFYSKLTGGRPDKLSGIVKHIKKNSLSFKYFIDVDNDPDTRIHNSDFVRPEGCTCSNPHIEIDSDEVTIIEKKK